VKTLPADVVAYKRTREFTEATVPSGLTSRHSTKADVWGRICVVEGQLRYRILEPEIEENVLEPGRDGVVEPEAPHEVEPLGSVRFFVEFLRAPR
jgi:tellurite resistance-related uncharacterized protein